MTQVLHCLGPQVWGPASPNKEPLEQYSAAQRGIGGNRVGGSPIMRSGSSRASVIALASCEPTRRRLRLTSDNAGRQRAQPHEGHCSRAGGKGRAGASSAPAGAAIGTSHPTTMIFCRAGLPRHHRSGQA